MLGKEKPLLNKRVRDRLSSVGSDKSLKEASLGKLTERQIAGAQIKKEQLQAKLREGLQKLLNMYKLLEPR